MVVLCLTIVQVCASWRCIPLCQLKSLHRDIGVSGKVWVRREVSVSVYVCVCVAMCVHVSVVQCIYAYHMYMYIQVWEYACMPVSHENNML